MEGEYLLGFPLGKDYIRSFPTSNNGEAFGGVLVEDVGRVSFEFLVSILCRYPKITNYQKSLDETCAPTYVRN